MDILYELYQQVSYRVNIRGRKLYTQTADLREKRDESKKKLMALLEDEGKDLLFHYEESLNEINGLELYEMFRTGVKAGATLLRSLSFSEEETEERV